MVISESCCTFIVYNYKWLQTITDILTEDKVTELFCMADDFCKFFDFMMEKYTQLIISAGAGNAFDRLSCPTEGRRRHARRVLPLVNDCIKRA